MTKIDLITGFLGVGKTTFIKKYADYLTAQGEKVHIIENEFGGLAIDARTLFDEDFDVSQITGGCMCCTGKISFQNLIMKAVANGYDRILVEPSGIYDVNSFFRLVNTAPVNTACEIGNVITIADSLTDDILSKEARYLMFSQLVYTGCVVASKTQLRSDSEVDSALEELQGILEEYGSSRKLKEENITITKPWDQLTEEDLAWIASCGYRMTEHADQVQNHMAIFGTTMFSGMFDTMDHLKAILHDLVETEKYGKIYRIKGYISDTNKHWYELNCSVSGCFVTEAKVKRGLFLVIGQGYDEETIKNLFISRRK